MLLPNQPLPDEQELFAAIAKGDEAAFTKIFYHYNKRLYPFVLSLLHSEVWAEEVVQDVFLNLWSAREKLVKVDSPQSYIFRMAANRTVDYMKRNGREIKFQYHLAQKNADTGNIIEEGFDYRQSEALLREAIESLPPKRKKVYQLNKEEGLSYAEIAEQLNISENTVRNHLAEAIAAIRSYLRGKDLFLTLLLYYWTKN